MFVRLYLSALCWKTCKNINIIVASCNNIVEPIMVYISNGNARAKISAFILSADFNNFRIRADTGGKGRGGIFAICGAIGWTVDGAIHRAIYRGTFLLGRVGRICGGRVGFGMECTGEEEEDHKVPEVKATKSPEAFKGMVLNFKSIKQF